MNRKEDFIAVFDSGVGGISVLRQLRRIMPNERYLYFGDSANAPYGTRHTQQIQQLSLKVAEHLMAKDIKALVVACNTATASAIDLLRRTYPDMIVVGIEPALKPAADRFPGGTIGVLATPVTLRKEKYRHLVELHAKDCQVIDLPAPGLSELVEHGKAISGDAIALLKPILDPWVGKLDALVLGCTHYPFATETIRKILGEDVPLFDGGEGTAREARRRLEAAGLLRDGQGEVVWENSLDDPDILALSKQLLEHD
jgi:glutamate racemase